MMGHRLLPREWEDFRTTIVELYLDKRWRLKDVQAEMEEKYGFVASERQYQEKFKLWGVKRNITESYRSDLVARFKAGERLNPTERRKLERQIKHNSKIRNELPSDLLKEVLSPPESSTPSDEADSSNMTKITRPKAGAPDEANQRSGSSESISSSGLPRHNSNTSLTLSEDPFNLDIFHPSPPKGTQYVPEQQNSTAAVTSPLSWWPTSPNPSGSSVRIPLPRNPYFDQSEKLLYFVQDFCAQKKSAYSSYDEETCIANTLIQSDQVRRTTAELKDIVYLYKLDDTQSIQTADRAIIGICNMPFEMVIDVSIQFLVELIATLAPINTRRERARRARQVLLRRFERLCRDTVGANHSFTQICGLLTKDDITDASSQKALETIQNALLCWSLPIVFKIELLFIALLRRQNDYDHAIQRAQTLIGSASTTFGPRSLEVRKTQLELSCIYIAQNDIQSAVELCNQISTRDISLDEEADVLSIRAKENLAECYRIQGSVCQSATVLNNAASDAVAVWGKSVATSHIIDKLFAALEHLGDTKTLAARKIMYSSFI